MLKFNSKAKWWRYNFFEKIHIKKNPFLSSIGHNITLEYV